MDTRGVALGRFEGLSDGLSDGPSEGDGVGEAGGDTDTIASMTGQIAGAWIGASNIPRNLIALLPRADQIERIVDEFAATV